MIFEAKQINYKLSIKWIVLEPTQELRISLHLNILCSSSFALRTVIDDAIKVIINIYTQLILRIKGGLIFEAKLINYKLSIKWVVLEPTQKLRISFNQWLQRTLKHFMFLELRPFGDNGRSTNCNR